MHIQISMNMNVALILSSIFLFVWASDVKYMDYEQFLSTRGVEDTTSIVLVYQSDENDDRTLFIFSELFEKKVVEEFENYHIQIIAVDCKDDDCKDVCKPDKICIYRKNKIIHEMNFDDIEKDTFFSQVLLNILENKVPRADSKENPLKLDRYKGKEDIYLLYLPMNTNIDKNHIGKVAYKCQNLSNIHYIIDTLYFEELFELSSGNPELVYLQCKHLDCSAVHLTEHLSLANIDQFLIDVDQPFELREKGSINEQLRESPAQYHMIMMFYDWQDSHQGALVDQMIAYVGSYRHKFRVLVQQSSDFNEKMDYTFPLVKIINKDKTQGYIIQGAERMTVDSLAYYMDIVEPSVTPIFSYNNQGYSDLFSKTANDLPLDLSSLTRIFKLQELIHSSFVLMYYPNDASNMMVVDKYRKLQQDDVKVTYVNCFDDFEICDHMSMETNAVYPLLVYYETKFVITFNDVWMEDSISNFIKSMKTIKEPRKKLMEDKNRVQIVILGKEREKILFPGIDTSIDVFFNNSSEYIAMQNTVASNLSRIIIQSNQEVTVCLPHDINCIRDIYLTGNMVEFNVKTMSNLYARGVPLLVYFSDHRLNHDEIQEMSRKFKNDDYPIVWVDINTSLGLFLKRFYFRKSSKNYKLCLLNKLLGVLFNYPAEEFDIKIFQKWIQNINSAIPSKSLTKMNWNAYGTTYSNQKDKDDEQSPNAPNEKHEQIREYDSDTISDDELMYEEQQSQLANSKCGSPNGELGSQEEEETIVLSPSYENYNPEFYKDEL